MTNLDKVSEKIHLNKKSNINYITFSLGSTNKNKNDDNLMIDKVNKNKVTIKHTINKKINNKCDNIIKNRPKWIDKELNQKNVRDNNTKFIQG